MTLPDGRTLAYTDVGAPDGRVVMYFHGAPSCRLDLSAIGLEPTLNDLGVRVVSADRPGYGGSSPQPGRSMDCWPTDVAALADHLGVDRFAVVGLSSGGPYAVAVAALLGRRVVGCGVVSGITDMGWPLAWDGYVGREIELMRLDEDSAVAWGFEHYGQDGAGLLADDSVEWAPADMALFDDQAVADGFAALSTESMRQGVAGYAQDISVQGRPWPFDPCTITARCRVLHGASDTLVPVAHAEHTAELLPNVQLIVEPDQGHLSMALRIPQLAAMLSDPTT